MLAAPAKNSDVDNGGGAHPGARAARVRTGSHQIVEPLIIYIEGSNPGAAIFSPPALRAAAEKMAEREGFEPSMRG